MNHLIICREYPPMRAGGIGTYALHISHLLAERGETVHVIGQQCREAQNDCEVKFDGKLIIHRIPFEDWKTGTGFPPHPAVDSEEERGLFSSDFHRQCFSWQVAHLTERLIDQEGIDVIEAEEYEAPLYYFMLRRALELGPKHQPPCIVHLHSPTEFVTKYNDKDLWRPYILTAKRLEEYCIGAADALLCPSQYLASQVESRYGLQAGSVQVIPYPIGNVSVLPRTQDVWANGSICYVGRLETRKGVVDWIDAAVKVVPEYPEARFEFVGRNMLGTPEQSGEEFIAQRIPQEFKRQFRFFNEKKRSDMQTFLGQARIAVIPSRWDNLPYTCLEAMCSGLPVITTNQGGMATLLEDGENGWLASVPGSEGLEKALRRALQTQPSRLNEMGKYASATIQKTCGNETIIEAHLEFRRHVVFQGVSRSSRLPINLPDSKQPISEKVRRSFAQNVTAEGVAVVVVSNNCLDDLCNSLMSLERQSNKPCTILFVVIGNDEKLPIQTLFEEHQGLPCEILEKRNVDLTTAKNAAVDWILGQPTIPLGIAFLHAGDELDPECLSVTELILRHRQEVGVVSGWTRQAGAEQELQVNPCPAFPYQWISNEVVSLSTFRVTALCEAGQFCGELSEDNANWGLVNALLAAGWVGVNAPVILGTQAKTPGAPGHTSWDRMAQDEICNRFSDLIARDAKELVLIRAAQVDSNLIRKFTGRKSNIFSRIRGKGLLNHLPPKIFRLMEKLRSFI